MTRSTQEVFDSHRDAIEASDFEKLAADYAEDAILGTLDGSFIGRDAILNGFFKPILSQYPDAKLNFEKTVVEDDVCLLQWSAEMSTVTIPRGPAVFIIRDGLIERQGEWFEILPKEG